MDRMQREEPSTVEKTQTDHIVPDTDRGLEDNRFTSIEDLLTSIYPHPDPTDEPYQPADGNGDAVYETSSSGMFPLDGPAAFGDVDKLSFFADVMKASPNRGGYDAEPCAMRVQTTREQPFIRVERGAEFADNFHEDFFLELFRSFSLDTYCNGMGPIRHTSVFCFLVFNILLRSSNRRISMKPDDRPPDKGRG
ncbi:uncharacterized protein HRG_11935 [Hirsutella rhossiliensis]|uniref:Uncharacterized protein n=1 Tax=Hirsutella rhossiliensis TaxID=111463 RepID=A0A9P8SBX3_9HYPO|nr:uncharacterized protein HRG_11935 [Hirsutella rhossiliensis]KAH0957003.1 hypothetical protein HRG_11935 [Hirsutella rhossiliensis]